MGLDARAVPNFTELPGWDEQHESGFQKWNFELQNWLKDRNLTFIEVRLGGKIQDGETEIDFQGVWQPLPFDTYCILSGLTPNNQRHAVVAKTAGEGFKPLFDPHPDRPGIAVLEGACFLVPRDPSFIKSVAGAIEDLCDQALEAINVKHPVTAIKRLACDLQGKEYAEPSMIIRG